MKPTPEELSLQSFQAKFQRLISTPTFGEPPHYRQRSVRCSESPASRELRQTGFLRVLLSDKFCSAIGELMEGYQELEAKRASTLRMAHDFPPAVRHYRSLKKRLENCGQALEEFNKQYHGFVGPELSENIGSTIALMDTVSFELGRRAKLLVSNIHPRFRGINDEESEWELLFKFYDDDMNKFGVKATDQWFWNTVNCALLEFIENEKISGISSLTRFKLIAAINEAAGHGLVPHTTVKQFFFEHPPQRA
jgi:hypothetical protein